MAQHQLTITRFLARHRRVLAALCAALAMLSLGLALRPPGLETVAVVVAERWLPTGHRLDPADLRVVDVAAAIAPSNDTAGSAAELTGRVLAVPVVAGEPIVSTRLLAPQWSIWVGPVGTSPMPVRFADAGAVDLVEAGLRLDVLAAGGAELGEGAPRAQLVANDVMVLGVVRSAESSGDDALGDPDRSAGGAAGRSDLVILAATRAQALAIAAGEAGSRLTFTLATGATAPASPPPQ